MGLFSLFKKTSGEPDPGGADSALAAPANSEARRQDAQLRQREIARATALKIDAIEAAMAFDIFNTPEPAWDSGPARAPRPAQPADDGATLALDSHSTELLGSADLPDAAAGAETAPVVEEIALLYANGQLELAEQMLAASLAGAGPDRTVWWMLFDLYQVTGQQARFDNLCIDYASTFETSPPAWAAAAPQDGAAGAYVGVTPTLALNGALDAAIAPALERWLQAADGKPVLRLEFHQSGAIETEGCALLLRCLQQLQDGRRELIVAGGAELAARIRASLRVGRREDGAPRWLLLLELLQLLKREKEFEETSMDYCVTFEVSPPPYVAPFAPAFAAAPARRPAAAPNDRFLLPAVVESPCPALLDAIDACAAQDGALVFDCTRLARLDFGAAGLLLTRLQALAREGKSIEFRDLNHLVAALLRLLAFSDIAKIFAHRY